MAGRSLNTARISRRLAVIGLLAAVGGCGFRPIYGDQGIGQSPNARQAMARVDVLPIDGPPGTPEGRMAVEVRNALLFDLQGGGPAQTASHKLRVTLSSSLQEIVPNRVTGRREAETYGLDAIYTLTDVTTGKSVLSGRATSRITFNTPGEQQRFARQAGMRDAEDKAAVQIAEQIKLRLATYFATGA
jgi:LPS-assembly lipoprotein